MATQTDFANRSFHNWNTAILQKEYEQQCFTDKYGNTRPYSQHNQSYSQFKKRK